ncbi:hypothetical protein RHSIM_Rhsim07G0148800 [Rhododendron simsii]|uniref:Uncharacterized protein n=1 Tax=Rhododendron simsii TaxID=118357 RepID=A0A834LJ03_RHOSS|nr:hypothetical protein RHSIM_Rhsim07G0148800 [Rhododendron simsii]
MAILDVLRFNEGTLPVKYLGVPLLSTKLKASDCQCLVESITARTKTWTSGDLTYADGKEMLLLLLPSKEKDLEATNEILQKEKEELLLKHKEMENINKLT